jgi:hypothetical protein
VGGVSFIRIDNIPMSFATIKQIQQCDSMEPLLVLFDSGCCGNWIHLRRLPIGATPDKTAKITGSTMAGEFDSNRSVDLTDLCFPEFQQGRYISNKSAHVFEALKCRYDLIVGRELMTELGFKIDFEDLVMTWDDNVVAMKSNSTRLPGEPTTKEAMLLNFLEQDLFVADILPSKYEAADVHQLAQAQQHLTLQQRKDLEQVLQEHTTLFDGHLKKYTGGQVHLNIDPTATPHCVRAYPVAESLRTLFKGELDRLVAEDVLEPAPRSEWIAGTFIIKKKDGRVRWITDFRGLNNAIRRKVYPIPLIADLLRRRKGYEYLTKLDISMQFYTFELDDESRSYTTIATPFGLYRYKRLPMGICESPDIAQEIMEKVLAPLRDKIDSYIDDVAVFSNSWEEHLELLRHLLTLLQDTGFTVNPLKCEWAVKETDFLGFWLTPTGLKPWAKKIAGMVAMQEPTNKQQLQSFLGMIGYYREMYPHLSDLLSPLTALTGTRTFQWSPECSKAFSAMKALLTTETMLAYPNHNLPFHIETDASDYQLGAVIKQNGQPVAYYSRKLNSAQRNYTTIEKELLSIVETLKKFRSMLLGATLHIHTDHRNLTHKMTTFQAQRVLRWRLLIEEFDCQFFYKAGQDNPVADALSRLPAAPLVWESPGDPQPHYNIEFNQSIESDQLDEDSFLSCVAGVDDCPNLADCLMEYPVFDEHAAMRHPFQFNTLRYYQQQSEELRQLPDRAPTLYKYQDFGQNDLICYLGNPDEPKIVLSDYMLPKLVKYYHLASAHAEGMDRLEATISKHFYHNNMRREIRRQIGTCETCQKYKRHGGQYGGLAPREALAFPWQEVHVDTIGPWTVNKRGIKYSFTALTAIDPVTGLLEIRRIPQKVGKETARALEFAWLSRYPKPVRCLHDGGPEFKAEFLTFLARAGILDKKISSANPQSNGIVEQVHKTVGLIIRVLANQAEFNSFAELEAIVDDAIHTTIRAVRSASHHSLDDISPGALVFRRDMNLDIPFRTDLLTLRDLRQRQIDKRLLRANAQRRSHDYKVGDQVLVKRELNHSQKLERGFSGPYPVLQVHTNGTLTLRVSANQRVRHNIRRLLPFRAPTAAAALPASP